MAKVYCFTCLFFGFAAGACYASIWSAELRKWFSGLKINNVHYMDDWFFANQDKQKLLKRYG